MKNLSFKFFGIMILCNKKFSTISTCQIKGGR